MFLLPIYYPKTHKIGRVLGEIYQNNLYIFMGIWYYIFGGDDVENYVTVKDAAQELGVTIATVYEAIREKKLPATRILGKWAVERKDLEARRAQTATVGDKGGRPRKAEAK